jgi:hypothetical protein
VKAYKVVTNHNGTLQSRIVDVLPGLCTTYEPGEWAENPHGPLYCYRETYGNIDVWLYTDEEMWECEIEPVDDPVYFIDTDILFNTRSYVALVDAFHKRPSKHGEFPWENFDILTLRQADSVLAKRVKLTRRIRTGGDY